MERIIQLHIEKLPEGVFLATSDDVQGLVAQGRTLGETLELARDIARKLMESQNAETDPSMDVELAGVLDLPVVIGA